MKQCTKCKEWKDESKFHKNKSKEDGLNICCKECVSIHQKKYYLDNIENIKSKSCINHILHKEERNRKSRINNSIYPKYFSKYNTFFKKLSLYEECKQDPTNSELLQVTCKYCNNWFNPTNKQVHGRVKCINKLMEGTSFLFCSDECKDKFNLKLSDEDYLEYKKYRRKVMNYLNKTYPIWKWWINPNNLERGFGKGKFHVDHIFSVVDGFRNKVPVEVIGNPFNLRMLEHSENSSKNGNSYITLGELYEDYNLYMEINFV